MIALRGLIKPSAAMNFVFDGNSFFEGVGASVSVLPARMMACAPLAGSGATYTNCGVGGQTLRMMNGLDGGSSADVDAAWVNGKYNVLVICEGTNSITVGGRTAQQAYDDAVAYIAARKAVHPWRVMWFTTVPRAAVGVDPQLRALDALVRANFRAMGIDVLIDARRPGSVYDFPGETSAGFQYTQSYWFETSGWVHPNDKGYQVLAEWGAAGARRLPKKPPT